MSGWMSAFFKRQVVEAPHLGLYRTFLLLALLFGICKPQGAYADSPGLPPPPQFDLIDANGVSMASGTENVPGPSVSIGPVGKGGLAYQTYWVGGNHWRDNLTGYINSNGSGSCSVVFLGHSVGLPCPGSGYSYTDALGNTLAFDGSLYTFTGRDGIIAIFDYSLRTSGPLGPNEGQITSLTYPTGEKLIFYQQMSGINYRLQSVTNNYGYQIKFNYPCPISASNCYPSVVAINNAIDYCDPTTDSCSGFTQSWPTLTWAGGSTTSPNTNWVSVTDALGNVTKGALVLDLTTFLVHDQLTKPSGRYLNYLINPDTGFVLEMQDGSTPSNPWQYKFMPADVSAMTVTDPTGRVKSFSTRSGLVTGYSLGTGTGIITTGIYYDATGVRPTRVVYPEENEIDYNYDSRGNAIERIEIPKPGSGLAPIHSYASYPATCDATNFRICNKPTSVTDANGNTTQYTYDSNHGGVLTETDPAVGGIHPQTRYTYEARSAWYRTSAPGPAWGTAVWNSFNWTPAFNQGSPVYVLTQVSKCMSGSSCAGISQEQLTVTGYTTGNSRTAANLQPISVTHQDGSGALAATISSTYDVFGNVVSTTGPISGDTKIFFYDANRRVVGTVGPDPDGGGALKNPATKTTYDVDGNITETETGTSPSQSYSDWNTNFVSLTQKTIGYDTYTEDKVIDKAYVGGLSYPVSATQYSYDGGRRLNCTAIRQNVAMFGSLPGACSQSTTPPSTFGYDRITHNNYDTHGWLTSVDAGYGSDVSIVQVTNTYTNNGKIASVKDANNNLSAYTYDDLDRLARFNFPSITTGSGTASATDYENYTYDNNRNLTAKRLRSSDTVTYIYDALNRQTEKHFSSGVSADVYFGYDLVGDRLYAHYGSAVGSGIDYTWDALGRKLTETSYDRTVSSQYDVAGNRTRLTYPDGNYIQYTYDILDRMQQVLQNGLTALATYSYDELSRVIGIGRSNPTATSMSYSNTSQDWSLTQDMAGTGQDVTFGLTFTPASQVYQRSLLNSAYAYSAPSLTQSYTSNGLNQYTSVGGPSYGYDARGNLTSDGGRGFSYDLENHLLGVSGTYSMSLNYDPLGRMKDTTVSSSTEQYLYDGDSLIAEYNTSGTVLRRYVPGRSVDETLVWYEGSGLTTPNWLHTDQQGSTIATSNSAGAATTYSYDPNGTPASWGIAPPTPIFRYTGQVMLPAVKLYYYKARIYDPTLGRFLQTDPVGYKDEYNLYAYVGNDPANKADPSGEDWRDLLTDPQAPAAAAEIVGGAGLIILGAGGDSGSAVATAGTGGLAAPLTVPAAVASTAILTAGTAATAHGLSILNNIANRNSGPKETGSYTNTHESQRTYSGKGSKERSQESAKIIERRTGDRHIATEWKPAESERQAFKDEHNRIQENGGPKSEQNYNQINSPGKKYLEQDTN